MGTNNAILDALIASTSLGPLPTPGDVFAPSLQDRHAITGRAADKFANGWLGGLGSAQQFQFQSSLLPILPPSSNDMLEIRIMQARGLKTGERILTKWERPNNFNPGHGVDTWRDGDNVTWTATNRGELVDPLTGLAGPVSYPALNRTDNSPMAPLYAQGQGLAAVTTAPVVMVASIAQPQGMSITEMQQASAAALTRARVKRGLATRDPRRG